MKWKFEYTNTLKSSRHKIICKLMPKRKLTYKFKFKQKSVKYRFVYAHSNRGGRYKFIYTNIPPKSNKGRYRFRYNYFDEIYYENPYTVLMLPWKTGQMERLFISLMLPYHLNQLDMLIKNFKLSLHKTFIEQSLNLKTDFKLTDIAKNYSFVNSDLGAIINTYDNPYELANRLLYYNLNNINLNLKDFRNLDLNKYFLLENNKRNLYKSLDLILIKNILKRVMIEKDKLYQSVDLELEITKIFDLISENKYIEFEMTKEFDKITENYININENSDKLFDSIYKPSLININNILTDNKSKSIYRINDKLIDLNSKNIYNIQDKLFKLNTKSSFIVEHKFLYIISEIINISKSETLTENIRQLKVLNEFIKRALSKINNKEYYCEQLIHSFMKDFKLSQNDYYFEKFMKETKNISNFDIQNYLEKEFKDYFNYNPLNKFDKLPKDINNLINIIKLDKELKPVINKNILRLLTCIPQNMEFEAINIILNLYSLKEISNKSIIKYTDKYKNKKGSNDKIEISTARLTFKNIAELIIENKLDYKASKEILFEFIVNYLEDYGSENLSIEELPPQDSLEDREIDVEKNILLHKKFMDLDLFKSTILAYEAKVIDLNNEHELKLWKRFWFLYADDIFDDKILPCCDFPYEQQPIEFKGFDDLMTENWQVVYPNTFWKNIDHHPIPKGRQLATKEIPLAINIMVEIINILILMWYRYYSAFWGWTGTQAVLGITESVFEWISLESSRVEQNNKNSKQHYDRCYRWLRWEAEKMALFARNDMELKGNYYVGLLLEDMINYMLDHHFDIMPIFEDVNKMDEWRNLFNKDLQNDITWILDKVKAIRHKLIIGREKKDNV